MGISGSISKALAPRISKAAPAMTNGFVRESLERAIRGVGPLPGAAATARRQLDEQHGDVDKAIRDLIEMHVRYAGAQGFVTNLGGLVTVAVTHPDEHRRVGPDPVPDGRRHRVTARLRPRRPPGPQRDPGHDPGRGRRRAPGEEAPDPRAADGAGHCPAPRPATSTAWLPGEVAAELITRVAGKRLASTVGRRIPVLGGFVGLGVDGFATWQIGRYADRELLPRARL